MKINLNGITKNLSKALSNVQIQADCKKPEILMVAGIAAGLASTVLACKATVKAVEVKKTADEQLNTVHELIEHPELVQEGKTYSEEDAKKDVKTIKIQTGVAFIKLYAPSIIAGGLALVSILGSHNIMIKRNTALAAAATIADQSFKQYRERVENRFGKETEQELYYGVEEDVIEETTVNKKGKEKTVQKKVKKIDSEKLSKYCVIFDETNQFWVNDAQYNLTFLKQQQSYWNDILKTKGFVFLNDVRKSLGFIETVAGQEMGWTYDEKNPNGDNFIDFGIFDLTDPNKRYFVNGLEKSVILNFNVDAQPIRFSLVKKGLLGNE